MRARLDLAHRLGLEPLRATALVFLGQSYALRRDREAMERSLALAIAAAPGDREIEGSAWGGRAWAALLQG